MGIPIVEGRVVERSSVALMARIRNPNTGSYISQASLSTVTFEVHKGDDIVTAETSLTIASVVYNSLQTTLGWSRDTTGYNFRYVIDGANFPDEGTYEVVVKFTPSSGNVFYVAFRCSSVKNRYGD